MDDDELVNVKHPFARTNKSGYEDMSSVSESETARVQIITSRVESFTTQPGQNLESISTCQLSKDWWDEFVSEKRIQPMTPVPVINGDEEIVSLPKEAFHQLIEWYGHSETLLKIHFCTVNLPEIQTQTIPPHLSLCSLIESILSEPSSEFDVEVGQVDSKSLSADYLSRLRTRPININSPVGNLSFHSGERIIVSRAKYISGGTSGLSNLGNTCYMNSSLQCLCHIDELVIYFLSNAFLKEINTNNPIGHGGRIARAFGSLIHDLYNDPKQTNVSPYNFKATVAQLNRAFGGYLQQDSQEFTAFLLDGLHEDLNRIVEKPVINIPDIAEDKSDDPSAIKEMADICWSLYKKRNDSIIFDLFTGMYKSTLTCPVCNNISIKFDLYADISMPLPQANVWSHEVLFFPMNGPACSLKVTLNLQDTVGDMREQIADLAAVNSDSLIVTEIYNNSIYTFYNDSDTLCDRIRQSDVVAAFETQIYPSEETQFPVFVYSGSHHYFIFEPFTIMASATDSVESLKAKINERFEDLTGLPLQSEYKLFKYSGSTSLVASELNYFPQSLVSLESDIYQSRINGESLSGHADNVTAYPESMSGLISPIELPRSQRQSASSLSNVSAMDLQANTKLSESPDSPENLDIIGCNKDLEKMVTSKEIESLISVNDVLVCDFGTSSLNKLTSRKIPSSHGMDPPTSYTLKDCLDNFLEPEVLGKNDLWYCNRCKDFRQASKKMEIWRAADILTIHLKRFRDNARHRDKISDLIQFPIESLDLSDRIQDLNGESGIYDLVAVDNHYGGLGSGHYTACARNPCNGEWYYYDDSRVTPTSPQDAVKNSAYLLFYRRRSDPTKTPIKSEPNEEVNKYISMAREQLKAERVCANETKNPLAYLKTESFENNGNIIGNGLN